MVTSEDLTLLDKMAPVFEGQKQSIPAPTLCPPCREQRRLSFRNQQTLYRRPCALCGQKIIAIYSAEKPHVVYCPTCWWSDKWDGLTFGADVDLEESFFDQFVRLMQKVPHISALQVNCQNSDYTNQSYNNRDSYLSSAIKDCDAVLYVQNANKISDCLDASYCFDSQLLYECTDVSNSYDCFFLRNCIQCTESQFLYDCNSCTNCFGCVGLRNKQYHFFNQPLSKDEYTAKIQGLQLHTFTGIQSAKRSFAEFALKFPHVYAWLKNCENVTGNNVRNSSNCVQCFDSTDLQDCRYSTWIFVCKDAMDCYGMGESELVYDCVGVEEVQHVAFSFGTSSSQDCFYTDLCFSSKNLFGCVGLRNQKYCILNKQYSQEEYETLVPKIIERMKQRGEYGEFFPASVSAFAYNETKAQEDYPLTKGEAIAKGFRWKDDIDEMPTVEKIIPAAMLPDSIDDIPEDILNWAIQCADTQRPFRITKKELEFYRQRRLPVPRLHPDIRRRQRTEARNPHQLQTRQCDKCHKEIQTTYAAGRPEIVFCEECYLKEMY